MFVLQFITSKSNILSVSFVRTAFVIIHVMLHI